MHVPLFGGSKSASQRSYEDARDVAWRFADTIRALLGYLVGRGQVVNDPVPDVLLWVPRTADSLLKPILTSPSSFRDRVDAGELVLAARPAAAGLLADLCAFLMFVEFPLDQSLFDLLGNHKKSGAPYSLDELLAGTSGAASSGDIAPPSAFSRRVSDRLAFFTKTVTTGDDAERAGAIGGAAVAGLWWELIGDRYPDLPPRSLVPMREWASAAQTLARLAVKAAHSGGPQP